MAKDFDTNSDLIPDTGNEVGRDSGADYGGDLSGDAGVDLNDGNVSKTDAAKRGGAAVLAGITTATGPFAPLHDQPTEYYPPPLPEAPAIVQPIDQPIKTPQEWAAEMGATIREGGPAGESEKQIVDDESDENDKKTT